MVRCQPQPLVRKTLSQTQTKKKHLTHTHKACSVALLFSLVDVLQDAVGSVLSVTLQNTFRVLLG
jgi:NAD-dependent oxidoreductase involved in siderophore biosynthesis